jgi:uncharacterized protein DUF1360
MLTLTALALLALASYRITRFIVFDGLFDGTRKKVHNWLVVKEALPYIKLYDLISCTWCVGVWVSAAIYWLYTRDFQLSVPAFLNIAAIAGAQGLLHAFEPDNED